MAASWVVNRGANTVTAGTTRWSSAAGFLLFGTTESNVKQPFLMSGGCTVSRLLVLVSANTLNASSTVTVRKNGAGTAVTVTIGASSGATTVEYTGAGVSFSHSDEISIEADASSSGSGSMTIQLIAWRLDSFFAYSCISLLTARGNIAYTADGATSYMTPGGFNSGLHTSASERALRMGLTGAVGAVARGFCVVVSADARTGDTEFGTEQNGSVGNPSVTVAAGVPGIYVDDSGLDFIAATDDYSFFVSTSLDLNTNAITFQLVSIEVESQYGEFLLVASGGATINAATTTYLGIGGRLLANATESNVVALAGFPFTVKEFLALVLSNSLDGPQEGAFLTTRKAGADTAQAVALQGSTGLKTSGGGVVPVSAENINYEVDSTDSASGSVGIQWVSARCAARKAPPPPIQKRRYFKRSR